MQNDIMNDSFQYRDVNWPDLALDDSSERWPLSFNDSTVASRSNGIDLTKIVWIVRQLYLPKLIEEERDSLANYVFALTVVQKF